MKRIFLFYLLVQSLFVKAQVTDSMIRVYASQVPDQKVYVHFDKEVYRAGETIWFKAYLFSGFSLSVQSRNFYAELINGQGNVIQRKVYPISASSAAGSFDLPDSTSGGSLVFRAYTTWMLNFDDAFLFQKNITVVHQSDVVPGEKTAQAKKYFIQFFPEGGNLTGGLHSVVAFKATDEVGMPVFAKGSIVDSKGAVVTSFSSLHDGMGVFNLTPVVNERYEAVWSDPSGRQQTIRLPDIKTQGIVLALTKSGTKRIFHLSRTDDVPESWKKVHILALLGQETVFKAKTDMTAVTTTSGAIPVETLPSGILQLTVFSDTWEPIAERIVMINNGNYGFDAKVNTAELNTNSKAKELIEIQVDDTLFCNLSLSVTDLAASIHTATDNIISTLLLTGDIKGWVHNPATYFADRTDSTAAKLDLVMLTHGWRRYDWVNMATGHKPVLKYPADNYLSIEATASGSKAASPLRTDEQLQIFIQGKDSSHQFLLMPKTGQDKFSLPDIMFYDSVTVYYEFMKDKRADKNRKVAFYNNFYKGEEQINLLHRPAGWQTDTAAIVQAGSFAGMPSQVSTYNNKNHMLAPVTVKTRVKSRMDQLDERYTSGLFRGGNGYPFDLTDQFASSYSDIFTYLQGKVPGGLRVLRYQDSTKVLWRGNRPALFLDEIPVDIIQISSIPVGNIAYVKVLRPPFMGAYMGGANGAIAVYTKRGADEKQTPAKGLNKSTIAGYSTPKEFYSPAYKDLSETEQAAADYRTTLYWNPSILTDSTSQKVQVEFYNNKVAKAFRIVLEGVNEMGKVVRIEKIIQ